MTESLRHPWGRVDETGTVFVVDGDGERAVGQYPDATAEEALAYFERKFAELDTQVRLLEQRARRGASASELAKTVTTLREGISTANAVGDLRALAERLDAVGGEVEELTETQREAAKAAVATAVQERTALVEEVEKLASTDPAKTQWKQAGSRLDELFARWQEHQREAPRLPKDQAGQLWKRFRDARATIERNRKAFFAELDGQHREVKARKSRLIEQAEALVSRGPAAVPDYRRLLDEWKLAGRAGKRNDDALWARFKAAGDALYAAKAEVDAAENAEFEQNLAVKRALLEEAEPLMKATDHGEARERLAAIQRRWDAAGKVPREHMRSTEDRMRKIESAVRALEEDHWRRNDPEKRARSESMERQLLDAISGLESELTTAKESGDAERIAAAQEALDARKAWLSALG